jgi:hypothetical protein
MSKVIVVGAGVLDVPKREDSVFKFVGDKLYEVVGDDLKKVTFEYEILTRKDGVRGVYQVMQDDALICVGTLEAVTWTQSWPPIIPNAQNGVIPVTAVQADVKRKCWKPLCPSPDWDGLQKEFDNSHDPDKVQTWIVNTFGQAASDACFPEIARALNKRQVWWSNKVKHPWAGWVWDIKEVLGQSHGPLRDGQMTALQTPSALPQVA